MCGITGFCSLGPQDPPAAEELVRRMADRLRHRGPDRTATWSSPSSTAFLGHTRLRVIDLEGGAQPMASSDGRIHVVFNGEIYNHLELRERLEAGGHVFRTRSDTEVLVHGYRAWGEQLPAKLEGMFAFAVWDEPRRRLFIARDRAGQKPLYVHQGRGFFAFGSEPKAVLAHPRVPRELDTFVLPYFLTLGYVPQPRTIYTAVQKLPPAHSAWVVGGRMMKPKRYWTLPSGQVPVSPTQARREVRRLLEEAVERRLESDVPLGAFLSGGIDSAAVVGIMSKATREPVRTFAIGFEGDASYDETDAARLSADHFGTRHTEFRVGAQSVELVDQLVESYDEPFGDSSAIPTHIVSGLAREHVTVALTGDGGDEVFAGYLRFRAMQWASLFPGWFSRGVSMLAASLPLPTDFRHPLRRGVRFFDAAAEPEAERMLRWVSYASHPETLMKPGWRVPPRRALTSSFRRSLRPRFRGETLLTRVLRLNYETYLPEDLLVKADRCSMAHGLELRSPFLDTALTEYVWRLPDSVKIRNRVGKAVLRDAVEDLLPPAILARPKMGFGIPLPTWFRGPWRSLLEDRLLDKGARIWSWLDPDAVQLLTGEHLTDQADHGHLLWALLTLEVWLEREDQAVGSGSSSTSEVEGA